MNRTQKVLLGIASFLPITLTITMMVKYILMIRELLLNAPIYDEQTGLGFVESIFGVIFPLAIVSLIIVIALLIIFIIHVVRNRQLSDAEQVVWIIAFFIAGAVAFPVYFFMRIAGKQEPDYAGTGLDAGFPQSRY